MTAAGEKIKSVLLGADDLMPLYDFGADALTLVADLFEAFGGLKTILYAASAALLTMY
jgi:hypothetical protein